MVRLQFQVTDALTGVFGLPAVTVNAHTATFHSRDGSLYEFRYTVWPTDPDGDASIVVSARDAVGNAGVMTFPDVLKIDNTVPTLSGLTVFPE